jgi:hypothetical protein
LPSWIVSNGS